MTRKKFFERLGAPLRNPRNSWGAVGGTDEVVFLMVWEDEIKEFNDGFHVRVAAYDKFRNKPNDVGWKERLEHIELVRAGRKCYLVMGTASKVKDNPREIKGFDQDNLHLGGAVKERDGDTWIGLGPCIPVADVAPPATHS